MFRVSSEIGRFQHPKQRISTPGEANRNPDNRTSAQRQKSDEEIIKQQNRELIQLKESYTKLREQYQQDKSNTSMKILALQNELRAEQRRVEKLENELEELMQAGTTQPELSEKSPKIVEIIFEVIQEYHEKVSARRKQSDY